MRNNRCRDKNNHTTGCSDCYVQIGRLTNPQWRKRWVVPESMESRGEIEIPDNTRGEKIDEDKIWTREGIGVWLTYDGFEVRVDLHISLFV